MSRKSRGKQGRLASPDQMARLREVTGRPLSEPIPHATYRRLLREARHSGRWGDKETDLWAHFQRERVDKPMAAFLTAFAALKHAARAHEEGDVIQ